MTCQMEKISDSTIYCADMESLIWSIGDVDHVITDPPYEQEAHTDMRRTNKSIKSGVNDVIGFGAITNELRAEIMRFSAEHCAGWLVAFCQVEASSKYQDAAKAAGVKYKRTAAWVKPDSSPQFNGQCPAQGFECISLSWCGDGASKWNSGGKRGLYTHNCNSGRFGGHPTEKPVSLMTEIVSDFTNAGDLVLDPFMGSGTTGVACAILGRRFIGIEMNPDFYEIAKKRISAAYAQGSLF